MYEENNKNNTGRQVLLSVLAVAILVVAVVGVSFAFFTYSRQGTTTNTISTGTLVFKYDEVTPGITLTNALPLTDDQAKTSLEKENGYFDFSVTSTIKGNMNISYDVIVEEASDPDLVKTLESKYVKVRLRKGTGAGTFSEDGTISYFDALTKCDKDGNDAGDADSNFRKLATDSFTEDDTTKGNNTHYYRFQMWMSDKYYNKGEAEGTTMMENDICTKTESEAAEVDCDCAVVGDETTNADLTTDTCTFVRRGTNAKTFSVRLNVVAKDAPAA